MLMRGGFFHLRLYCSDPPVQALLDEVGSMWHAALQEQLSGHRMAYLYCVFCHLFTTVLEMRQFSRFRNLRRLFWEMRFCSLRRSILASVDCLSAIALHVFILLASHNTHKTSCTLLLSDKWQNPGGNSITWIL